MTTVKESAKPAPKVAKAAKKAKVASKSSVTIHGLSPYVEKKE